MISKIIAFLFCCCLVFVLSAEAEFAYALDATPSASTVGLSETLKNKINDLKSEIASKAAVLKLEMGKKLQNKAIAGLITEVSDDRITIKTINGERTILTNTYTVITSSVVSPKSKGKNVSSPPLAVKDLLNGDFISALGDLDDKNNLVAKKIIKSEAPKWVEKIQFEWGQIVSKSDPYINLKNKDGHDLKILTSSNTDYFLGSEEASLLDAKEGKFLIVRAKPGENIWPADFIYFLPRPGFIHPEKKSASGSAEASASPKGL